MQGFSYFPVRLPNVALPEPQNITTAATNTQTSRHLLKLPLLDSKAMSSRLVASSLPMRAVTRSAAIVSARCSEASRVKNVNHKTTNFATLNDGLQESSTQVLPSPTPTAAKSLSHQIRSLTPPSTALSRPFGVFAKTFEEDREVDRKSRVFVHGEKQDKIARAWEPVEKELWLERLGGPGRTIERVAGKGTVVLRDVGGDGKAYLRVLI